MNWRRKLIVAVVAAATINAQAQTTKVLGRRITGTAVTFCSGTFAICEENWADLTSWDGTASVGTWTVSGGHLIAPASGASMLTNDTAAGGSHQYAIVRLDTLAGRQGVFVRGTASSFRYGVYNVAGVTYWSTFTSAAGFDSDIGHCTIAWVADDYMMVDVSGSGSTTILKVWRTATMPTAAPSGTADCTFTGGTGASATGNGSAAACDASLCSPITAASGNVVGLYDDSAASGNYDDFAAGGS